MAATRERAVAYFVFDGEPVKSSTDTSALAWEILSHGLTRRVFKQATSSIYRRYIRPIFSDETPDEMEDKESLAALGLEENMYTCNLKVGEDKDKKKEEEEEKLRKKIKGKGKEKKKSWLQRQAEDNDEPKIGPELYVRIRVPRRNEILSERIALAYCGTRGTINGENSTIVFYPQRVHVKWSSDLHRLKALYHEAEVYDFISRDDYEFNYIPKFYGFYERFAGKSAFGFSVFERSRLVNLEGEKRDNRFNITTRFVLAAQKLHERGICHGSLLTGTKETGFAMTKNVRYNEETGRIVFVNFENATKHKGFICPSTKGFQPRGCKELDDILEFHRLSENNNNFDDTGSDDSVSL